MKSNYKRLGEYIREINVRNTNLENVDLLGVSIQKVFIPSIANTIGTNMVTYKLIKKGQFAYGPVTSRNGDKISVALLDDYEKAMISQAYTSFEIIDENLLLSEYLMMWFRRPEFDRYARFMSHGSAREIFSWEEMCNTLLPVPPIAKQKEIVKEYNVIINRIKLNELLIRNLEETAQVIYKQWFVDFEFPDKYGQLYKTNAGEMVFNKDLNKNIPKGWEVRPLSDFCDIKGGKRLPRGEELNNENNGNPYIKVADMKNSKLITLDDKFQYVEKNVQKEIANYIVSKNDVIVSIVGTIGLVNVVHETLHNANLTENCLKITNMKGINSDFLYHFLSSSTGQRMIETKTVGGVQGKLPLYNIKSLPVVYPNKLILEKFKILISHINSSLENFTSQNVRLSIIKGLLLSKLALMEDNI